MIDQLAQRRLQLDLPTGLGKTSVMAIWLLARALVPGLPRRLIYVVDRRAVVDQATTEALKLRDGFAGSAQLDRLRAPLGLSKDATLPVSTLRGQYVDNREWLADPERAAIVVGTIDMIGSRLLFEGYGVGRGMRPYQAGLLGADTLVVLDEAHLCPPFEALLRGIEGDEVLKPRGEVLRAVIPGLRLLALSATGRTTGGEVFRLEPEDHDPTVQPIVHERFTAAKRLLLEDVGAAADLPKALAERAWRLGDGGHRVLVFCDTYADAKKVEADLRKRGATELPRALDVLVGKRRVHERERLVRRLVELGFIHPAEGERPARESPAFLVATSAGEVGIDIDADSIVCDLVAWERMVQRLGRVNRRGGEGPTALVDVLCPPPVEPKSGGKDDAKAREKDREATARTALPVATRALLEALPMGEDGLRDASPQALAELNERLGAPAIEAATTPAPLRPVLDRAVVDAWSMTSLPEHPGRPEPEPWLRGWVEDEEPQCRVIWRRFLPWLHSDDAPAKAEVEAFFDAARPHASEVLEAPVDRVVETLLERARALLAARRASPDTDSEDGDGAIGASTRAASETRDGLIVLSPARELKRRPEPPRGARPGAALGAWTVEDLAKIPPKGKPPDQEALRRLLTNATVVVSASLGGLDGNGLLAKDGNEPPSCGDAEGAEVDGWATGFRVRVSSAAEDEAEWGEWKPAFRLPLTRADDEEPRLLTVLVSRAADGGRAGDLAIGRRAQALAEHGDWAAEAAGEIADALGLAPPYKAMLTAAAQAHDVGKNRPLWQNAMAGRERRDGRPYAKSRCAGDPARLRIGQYTYWHEFGSLKDIEADPTALADVPEALRDLARHLIAAHHGFARPLIAPVDPASTPAESEARAAAAALRFARLQRDWGPWGLAWWEALLRAADWRASARNDAAGAQAEPPPDARAATATEPA